jgi:hypothetical protein
MPDDSGGIRATSLWTSNPLKEQEMKKIIFLAAVFALTACAGGEKKAEAPASSEAPAAGAPATGDSMGGMQMQHDSTMARDTTKKM